MKGAVHAVCKIFGPNVKWYFFWSFLLYLATGGVMLLPATLSEAGIQIG